MKTIVVAACAALVAATSTSAEIAKPHLRLADTTPLVVTGTGFGSHERVRVVYKSDQTWTRRVTATTGGHFTARFPVAFEICAGRVIYAIGSMGSKAYLRFPPPACPPPVSP